MKSQPDFAGPLGYHLATFDGPIRGENSARQSGTQALIEEPSCLASGCSGPFVSLEILKHLFAMWILLLGWVLFSGRPFHVTGVHICRLRS